MRLRILKPLALAATWFLAALVMVPLFAVQAEEEDVHAESRLDATSDEDPGWDFEARIERIRIEEGVSGTAVGAGAEHGVEAELRAEVVALQPWFERHPVRTRRVADIVYTAAMDHGVDPHLALAWASRESGFRAGASGSLGEQGLFQVMPRGHARRVCDPSRRDLGQPRVNADVALCYYAHLVELCGTDDPSVVTAAYGTGRCMEPEAAKRLACVQRKRGELARAVGEERADRIWPM